MISRIIDALLETSIACSFSSIGIDIRRHTESWEPLNTYRIDGLTVIASGITSGIGHAAATLLAENGARIIGLARNKQLGEKVLAELSPPPQGEHQFVQCNLADFDEVFSAAKRIGEIAPTIDRVLHIAGSLSPTYAKNINEVEETLATHLIGPYLLTRELEARFEKGTRVIWVSSGGMYTQGLNLKKLEMQPTEYKGRIAYARAKRAQVVIAELLADKYQGHTEVHSMHPGWVDTPILQKGMPLFRRVLKRILRTPEEGADTLVWLTCAPIPASSTGSFWHDRRQRRKVSWPGTRSAAEAQAELLPWIEKRIAIS